MYIEDVELQFNEEKQIIGDFFKIKDSLLSVIKNNVGKKCFKVDGSKTAKFKEEIEKITSFKFYNLHYINIRLSHKSIYLTMKYCFRNNDKQSCHYRDLDFYLGEVDDTFQVIKEVTNNTDFAQFKAKLEMDFSNVKETILKVGSMIKECEELQGSLPYYAKFTLPYVGNLHK